MWKRIAVNRAWVTGATITETIELNANGDSTGARRFTATIRGWGNFKIWEGNVCECDNTERCKKVMSRVREIMARIDAGDESVFHKNAPV